MIHQDPKEDLIRQNFLKAVGMSRENRCLADRYLNMDAPEDASLLSQAEHQCLDLPRSMSWMGREYYPGWLKKKKRTEELGRYIRLIVAVGGASAWNLIETEESFAEFSDLESSLSYLSGEESEGQKTALRAGMCFALLSRRQPEAAKSLCASGAEHPEIFREAMKYCYSASGSGSLDFPWMLLAAMYLHHQSPGTAPEITKKLEGRLVDGLSNLAAFERRELNSLQEYVRTAQKDTPFPRRILSILSQRRAELNTAFLSGCAFLALRHSLRFEIVLRLLVACDFRYAGRSQTLQTCMEIVEEDWFDARMEEIEEMLPVLDEVYILWCLEHGYEKAAERMAVRSPDGIREAAKKAESGLYQKLMETVERANPDLYEELHASGQEIYREKLVSELTSRVYPGKAKAKEYLLGICPVEDLEEYLPEWGNDFYNEKENYQKLTALKTQEPSLYRRGVVLEALRKMTAFFAHHPIFETEETWSGGEGFLLDMRQLEVVLEIFEEEKVSIRYQMEALGGMGDSLDNRKKRAIYFEQCAEAFVEYTKEREDGVAETMQKGSAFACCLCLKVLSRWGAGAYKDLLLSCVSAANKKVRAQLLDICREHREWLPDVLKLFESKKLKEREFALLLLDEWGEPSSLEAVKAALDKEKNPKLRSSLQTLLEELAQEAEDTKNGSSVREQRIEERLASEIYRGSRKKKVEWVTGTDLPPVHRRDQGIVQPEYLLAILTVYADMEFPGIHPDAKRLAAPLDQEELSLYMQTLYEGWLSAGAEAKKRWVLYAVSIHGGARMVPVLHRQIQEWAEHQRGAMAAETVRALVLSGSTEALLLTDQMSRKCKFRQIRNAAKEALSDAAKALGIPREELEDRLVPDLGFDGQMEQVYDYGSRRFTVRLEPGMQLVIRDEKGKTLKNLPVPGKQDDPEKAALYSAAFKQMKKQLREVFVSQKLRLEQALSSGRFWEAEKWRELFVKNPVMRSFAEGLIWGVYEGRELKETFRYMEDGSFNTSEEEPYAFPAFGQIGLVHPLELSEEKNLSWKEQLSDYEITQPLEQLKRPVFRVTEEEKGETALLRFAGSTLHGLSLSGGLLKLGWFRGRILDAGFFENFYRRDEGFGAELTFSGSSVGYEYEEVTLKNLYFYRIQPNRTDGGTSDIFQDENRCALKDVEARYFSEVVLQITKVAGTPSDRKE